MRKSHLRIQSAALSALQEATEATIITNFADEHVIVLWLSIIDFHNDKSVRYSREKNDDSSEEFKSDEEFEKNARLLRLITIYCRYK